MKCKLIVPNIKFTLSREGIVLSGELLRSSDEPVDEPVTSITLEGDYKEVCENLKQLILEAVKSELNLCLMESKQNAENATKSVIALSSMQAELTNA